MVQRRAIVRIKNTGNVTYTFWVGATIAERVSGSGCGIWIPSGRYRDLPPKSITLRPGETGSVTFYFDDAWLTTTTQYFIAKVWKQYDRTRNVMIGCLAGTYKAYTKKQPPVVISRYNIPTTMYANRTNYATFYIKVNQDLPSGQYAAYRVYIEAWGFRFDANIGGFIYTNRQYVDVMARFTYPLPRAGTEYYVPIRITPRGTGTLVFDIRAGIYDSTTRRYTWTDTKVIKVTVR